MLKTTADGPLNDREWQDFLRSKDFGQIVALGSNREVPLITPTHFIYDESDGVEFHLHRANPLFGALRERPRATLTVLDAPCYIPGTWNCEPGDDVVWSAPTSYYAAVHATGSTHLVEGADLASLLNRQLQHFQPEGGTHRVETGSSIFGRALGAIVGVRMTIERVEAKFKFGGNRTIPHRLEIAEKIAGRGGEGDVRAIFHMLRRIRTAEAASKSQVALASRQDQMRD